MTNSKGILVHVECPHCKGIDKFLSTHISEELTEETKQEFLTPCSYCGYPIHLAEAEFKDG